MTRLIGFRGLQCATLVVVSVLSGRPAPAEPLRLITDVYSDFDSKAPGYSVEVIRHVVAGMGQDASFESFPTNRAWRMILRGERDGLFGELRTSDRDGICSFPDEPLTHERRVLFVRAADVGKLKFSSFDDLVGHDVAISESFLPSSSEHPDLSPELWKFLLEHHNGIETSGTVESFRMLAAGRVDYAVAGLTLGKRQIATMGLSGKIEPILSRSVVEQDIYVCFTKSRVSPAFVDAFSRALKQFKETEAFQAIYHKYLP